MDNRTLTGLLKAVPETRLRILEMAAEAARPDGSIDFDRLVKQDSEFETAKAEAENYSNATKRLCRGLKWKLTLHQG